ncbi:MAG: InlB B-repeat-containing protein [Alphaproteobacteria bacterium]
MSIILISAPSFAYVTDSSQCDNDVLSTYTGPANLTANWQGNNISVTWYNGDTEYDSNQCTYGGNLTMPSSIPTKTGYTFKGWRVKCILSSLSGLNTSISTSQDATHMRWKSIDPNGRPMADDFGTENSSDLNNGEWALTFSYGTVKGMAKCSAKSGNNNSFTWPASSSNWSATESELTSASGEAKYCWCHATNYTPNGGNQCNVASPSWVYRYFYESASDCPYGCARSCAYGVQVYADFRRALFGVQ